MFAETLFHSIFKSLWTVAENLTMQFDELQKNGNGRKRPLYRKKFPIRTGIAAATLFGIGLILILVGANIGTYERDRGLALIVLGCLAFIPGAYSSYLLFGAYKGWRGYDYSAVPSYDD